MRKDDHIACENYRSLSLNQILFILKCLNTSRPGLPWIQIRNNINFVYDWILIDLLVYKVVNFKATFQWKRAFFHCLLFTTMWSTLFIHVIISLFMRFHKIYVLLKTITSLIYKKYIKCWRHFNASLVFILLSYINR